MFGNKSPLAVEEHQEARDSVQPTHSHTHTHTITATITATITLTATHTATHTVTVTVTGTATWLLVEAHVVTKILYMYCIRL